MAGKSGISVSLPLTYDLVDGPFYLNKTAKEAIQQNLKNLVLTNPGERIMDPSFGVGLRTFLFEQINDETYTKIATKIRQQLVAYLPFINVNGIYFDDASTNSDLGYNEIHLGISYNIAPLDINDTLSITTLLN
jgi:phage baseplate assembly protein W